MANPAQKPDKKQRIIDAAIKEFAEHGYTNTSTNKIIEEAGVSKGVLFYYFENKEKLYAFLIEYVIDLLRNDVLSKVDVQNPDIFALIKTSLNTKLFTIMKYPLEAKFYANAYTNDVPDAVKAILEKNISTSIAFTQNSNGLFDESLLRDGVDKEKVLQLVDWTCRGMIDDAIKNDDLRFNIEGYKNLTEKTDQYFDFLRKLVYKEDK